MSMALRNKDMLEPVYELILGGKKVTERFKNYITEIEFEDSDCEAGLARITVNDMDFIFSSYFDFCKGTTVNLTMGYKTKNRCMLKGVVSHFEASFGEDGVQTLVIGAIDTSSNMNYVKKHRSWRKAKRSDVASAIAGENGFCGVIQNTGEVIDQITQENETDAQFLKKLAGEEGYEFYVFPDQKKLYFGDKFKDLKVKDSLNYKIGDQSIISFSPSLVERNRKENVKGDKHASKDKSSKSGKTKGDENKGGGAPKSSGMSATVNVTVNDADDGVDIVGLTGAQI